MKNRYRYILGIVLAIFVAIPVFATNYVDNDIKIGNILCPGDNSISIESDFNVYYKKNPRVEIYKKREKTILSLKEYNSLSNDADEISEKNDKGEEFIGWKVISYKTSGGTNGYVVKEIEVEPFYSNVKHKIIVEPETKKTEVNVSEEQDVKEYQWYKRVRKNKLAAYTEDGTIDENYEHWRYDEETNTYSANEHYEHYIYLRGYIDFENDSEIEFNFNDDDAEWFNFHEERFDLSDYLIIYDISDERVLKRYIEKEKLSCENNQCKLKIDNKTLKAGKYMIEIDSRYTNLEVKFNNANVYTVEEVKLDGENSKILSKGEDGQEYFVTIEYNDGILLKSNSFKYEKNITKEIENKVTDIVSNPLTGDNIIYTVIACLIALISIIFFTKKLKNN